MLTTQQINAILDSIDTNTSDEYNSPDRIFIRKPTAAEKRGSTARHRGFSKNVSKDGYEIVYCPYGNDGKSSSAGYYYNKIS